MAGAVALAAGVVLAAGLAPAAIQLLTPTAGDDPLLLALDLANAQDSCAPFRFVAAMEGLALPSVALETTTNLHSAIHAAVDLSRSEHDAFHGQLPSISLEMQASAATLLSAITLTEKRLDKAWARVTEQDYATLASEPLGSPVAMAILEKVDRPQVLSAACALSTVVDGVVATLSALPVGSPQVGPLTSDICAPPPVVVPAGSADPVLVIGGTGCDEYVFSTTKLSIDPDGNDIYNNNPGAAIGGTVPNAALAIDLNGNDVFNTLHAVGDTKAIGILVDAAGGDTYLTGAQHGTAWNSGIALLRDRSGADSYTCFTSCQGTGTSNGVGILWDDAGDDMYTQGHASGQGYGRSMGTGILLDQDGADRYLSTVAAQGFSGAEGTGVLVDRAGSDTYNVSHSQFGRATHNLNNPANWGTMIFLDMNGDDDYQRRADDGPPPDSRDAGSGTPPLPNPYRWGPGQTGTFYIRGMDCEAAIEVCVQQL